jgi:hypothetical protein
MQTEWSSMQRASERGSVGRWMALAFVLCLPLFATPANALVIYRDSWDDSACGWSNRPAGPMVIRFSSTHSPDAGSLAGGLGGIDVPSPDFDVFKADDKSSGGMFVGDYLVTQGQVPYSLSFDFLPVDVLPSSLIFRFRGAKDGVTNTFFTCLMDRFTELWLPCMTDQCAKPGTWNRVTVPFQFNSNVWMGGAADAFSNALMNVQWIEVQVGRRGTNEQTYVLDNFARVDWFPRGSATNDTDADGMPDFWEEAFFDGTTNGLSAVDEDGDGVSNVEEYRAGTHPRNAFSYPEIGIAAVGAWADHQFLSSMGRFYQIQHSTNLLRGGWTALGAVVAGSGGYLSVMDTNAPATGYYRFRVWVQPPP